MPKFTPENIFTHAGKAYVGKKDIANYFGVTTRTIERWTKKEGFPGYFVSGRNIYRLVECRTWFEENKLKRKIRNDKNKRPSQGEAS
jgi:hypothetical protein